MTVNRKLPRERGTERGSALVTNLRTKEGLGFTKGNWECLGPVSLTLVTGKFTVSILNKKSASLKESFLKTSFYSCLCQFTKSSEGSEFVMSSPLMLRLASTNRAFGLFN